MDIDPYARYVSAMGCIRLKWEGDTRREEGTVLNCMLDLKSINQLRWSCDMIEMNRSSIATVFFGVSYVIKKDFVRRHFSLIILFDQYRDHNTIIVNQWNGKAKCLPWFVKLSYPRIIWCGFPNFLSRGSRKASKRNYQSRQEGIRKERIRTLVKELRKIYN